MITVETRATVTYTCWLNEEDSQKVLDFLETNTDYDTAEAVSKLYADGEIDLYDDSVESDFITEEITNAEIDE